MATLKRYPVRAFFLLSYIITWIFWVPMALVSRGALPGVVPVETLWAVGVIGPICAAVLVTCAEGGALAVRRLLSRLVRWRVGARWYVVAVFARALPMLLAAALSRTVLPFSYQPWVWLTSAMLFLGGAVCEETGWRGWALPSLEKRLGPWWASVVLGILWAVWHVPQFFTLGDEHANRSSPCSSSTWSLTPS